MSICSGPVGAPSRADTSAAPPGVVGKDEPGPEAAGTCGSGSRMSAPSPRPSAFLVIYNYLLGELCVTLCPFAVNIIENNGFTETGCLRQTHVAGDYALKYLRTEKTTQIRGYLT